MSKDYDLESLEWGSICVRDVLKSLYEGKNIENMCDTELNQLLEDLI